MFTLGRDFFHTLEEIGLPSVIDARREDAEAAWRRSGALSQVLAPAAPSRDAVGMARVWTATRLAMSAACPCIEARELGAKLWLAAGETPAWMRGSLRLQPVLHTSGRCRGGQVRDSHLVACFMKPSCRHNLDQGRLRIFWKGGV